MAGMFFWRPRSTILSSGDALDVFGRDDDLSAKSGVSADVFELRNLIRLLVEQLLDPCPLPGFPIVEFLGPLGFRLDDQRFTIRIKFVGHVGMLVSEWFVSEKVGMICLESRLVIRTLISPAGNANIL